MTAPPLASYSHEWKALPQQIVPIAATKPPAASPPDMVRIPRGEFLFKAQGIEIEGSDDMGVDVQYPWEDPRGASMNIPCRSSHSGSTRIR